MAVQLRGVSASYSNFFRKPTPVLKDIDLHIEAGQIYGILGPSGCGKTTLLRCMLGRHKVDKGTIMILGQPLGSPGLGVPGPEIGYMPQDLAVAMELTIGETLWYFSCLVGMDKDKATERKLYLLKFLNLCEETRLVKDLSGGQRRRVSLAATLLHQPPILVLDEPTVGVDPQLRFSIWEHLIMLARDVGTTIIITTHYTEEARNANAIGLMRHGKFVVQSSPDKLLETFGKTSLESVFLHLCNKDRESQILDTGCSTTITYTDNSPHCLPSNKIIDTEVHCKIKTNSTVFRRLYALVARNAIVMWRNKPTMIFQLLMPILHVLLFYYQVGSDIYDFSIAVVNDDQSFLGGVFLNSLDSAIIAQREFHSKESALESVRNGKMYATIHIPANFSEAILTRFMHGHHSNKDTVDDSSIRVWFDTSNFQVTQLVTQELWVSYEDFIKDSLKDMNQNKLLGNIPIAFEKPVYGDSHPRPLDFIMPSLFAHIPFFLSAILTALVLLRERSDGLLDRSWVAGITGSEVMASHLITQGIFMICETSIPVIWYFGFVGNAICRGPVAVVILQVFLQGLCGLVYGLFLSAILPDESTVILACVATLMICLNLCGFVWPMEAMPTWLCKIGYIFPQTIATRAIRSVMLRGWNLQYFQVFISIVQSIIWSVLGTVISAFIMHLRR